jgi:propane monooxygenase reductase subunit
MAPILSLLRSLSGERTGRMVRFFYGARTQADLFYLDLVQELGANIPDFEFVPVLSEEESDDHETGFVHEAVDRYLGSGEVAEPQVYMCGPPPMIDAAAEMLEGHGIDDSDIFHDKFTTSADAQAAAS